MVKRGEADTPSDHPELKHPSTKRAKEIDASSPYEELKSLLESQSEPPKVTQVVHWFRSKDLRIHDNRALHEASCLAQEHRAPLVCIHVNCPAELRWHGTSPARVDFIFENLRLMREELAALNIPLVFIEAVERDLIVPKVEEFVKAQGTSHLFANHEYEVDELRRDIQLVKRGSSSHPSGSKPSKSSGTEGGFQVSLRHDQTVLEPGTMLTGGGKPMQIFTPYHRAWLNEVKSDPSLLDTVPAPSANPKSVKSDLKSLFTSSSPPSVPKEKQFGSTAERDRVRKLWPAGHDAGISRMKEFTSRIDDYAATRSNPGKDSTSRMSAYFAAGVVSVREALQLVKSHNRNRADFSTSASSQGVSSWVREIVFRELYRQTLLCTPHISMNLPCNLKFEFVNWEDDEECYRRWEEGTLGVPLVDAGMRQLKHEAWMHNRARMNVSSYLYCNLLVDYRRGERYFAETLVDWDLGNNTQGWEPSYTVFNPVSQAEKNDPDGEYIRRWIPELRDVKGKAVFDPYHRLGKEEFEKLGYPAPYVDWKETKQRAVARFKEDMAEAAP